jgi:hypothetical protein
MYTDTATGESTATRSPKRWILWTGRVVSALPILVLLFSASMKFRAPPMVVDHFVRDLGFPASMLIGLALLEVACTVIYAIPSTAILGAVLLTGYLGGAIVTHLRAGESFVAPLMVGILVWGGLYLREPRLHPLLPLRRQATGR